MVRVTVKLPTNAREYEYENGRPTGAGMGVRDKRVWESDKQVWESDKSGLGVQPNRSRPYYGVGNYREC